ncbi:MAG: hypothetical protein KF691_02400 [Phycisphaeraceae bacterium]|nr:hypothetical protein [Phycisphaeraceae bacterium]
MGVQVPILFAFVPLVALSGTSFAGLSQNVIASPGGFLQAGCDPGPTGGGFFWPGYDLAGAISGAGSMLNESSFVGLSVAANSASSSATNLNNNSSGIAGMGYVLINAFNNAPNNNQFPLGAVNGGWKETFTVTNPNYTGQAGYLVFEVAASGFLKATGFAGAASVLVTAYKDNNQLMANQYFNPGDSDLLSTDRQYGNWAIATYGNPSVDSKSFNDSVTMAVPITFGTPFTLGVYAWGKAGMRSSSGVAGNSTAFIQDGKVRWGGILNVLAGGNSVIATSTVSGASGKDWGPGTQPPDPCPGDLNNDGFVDDADFVVFVNAYNILDCADPSMPVLCPADMNGDGFVDDADFVLFVAAYNDLVCV